VGGTSLGVEIGIGSDEIFNGDGFDFEGIGIGFEGNVL
jgi:hypothetical protein